MITLLSGLVPRAGMLHTANSATNPIRIMSHSLKLTPEMERFAEEQVHAGNYKSLDEVARAAFSLLRENARRRDAVRQELSGLFEEMDAGKAIPSTDEDFASMVRERAAKHTGH